MIDCWSTLAFPGKKKVQEVAVADKEANYANVIFEIAQVDSRVGEDSRTRRNLWQTK